MRRKVIYKPSGAKTSELEETSEQTAPQVYPRTPATTKTGPKFWTTCLVVFAITCLLPLGCLLAFGTAPNMEKTLARVPIGSKLSELDELAVTGYDSLSDVYEWVPVTDESTTTEKQFSNEHGTFTGKDLGSFDNWSASDKERDSFTGEIDLVYFSIVIPDDLNPSFIIIYIYVEGRLVKKDMLGLPG